MITIATLVIGIALGLLALPYILIFFISVAFAILAEHADITSIYNLMVYKELENDHDNV